jgi:hypothetical protein
MEVPMKRTTIVSSMLVFLLALTLASCDSMFNTNIFAKMTHKTPSVSEIQQKSPDELKTYIASEANMTILTDNEDLKAAALDTLAAVYASDSTASASDQQTAAVVAADISIQTVPVAAQFSSDLLASVVKGNANDLTSTDSTGASVVTEASISDFVETILPSDIVSSIQSGDTTPPQTFTDLITAFASANEAYAALGSSLTPVVSSDGTTSYAYADGVVDSSASSEVAVNAVIAGLITAVIPATATDVNGDGKVTSSDVTAAQISTALWAAMLDPANASSAISIDSSVLDSLTSTDSSGTTSSIAKLVLASGLGSLLGGL